MHPDRGREVDALVGTTHLTVHRGARERLLDTEQRRLVGDRRVGAAGDRDAARDEALRREHRVGAVLAVVADVAVPELPEERGLHDGHDPLAVDPRLEIRRADPAVLDPVAQPVARGLALGPGHRVERLLDGAIADRVHRALKAEAVRAPE